MIIPKDTEEKCKWLADEIRKILSNGITLNSEVVHFIDSTFSSPTISELEDILRDDTNCEKDSLLELLFFPDESMQLQLEELLETLQLHRSDEDRLLELLCREPLQAVFRFPEKNDKLSLLLPPEVAPLLISRLHIAKHLNPKLRDAINNRTTSGERNCYKVKIRNSRFPSDENKIRFLCDFFDRMEPDSHDLSDCLDLALSLLDEIKEKEAAELYQALMAKKRFYLRSLEKAKQLDTQLQKSNLETLLLEGKRIILVDKADARRKMLIIDRISRAIYGKTEYFEEFHSGEDRMEFRSDQDIQEIIKQLS